MATAKAYQFPSYLSEFSSEQLKAVPPGLHVVNSDLRKTNERLFWAAFSWQTDPHFREALLQKEAEQRARARQPAKVAPATAPAVRAGQQVLFKHLDIVSEAVGRYVREVNAKALERMEAGDSRVLKLEALCHEQGRRIDDLQLRLAEQQRRYDGQKRHLANLETRITGGAGGGRLEHGSRPRTEGSE